MGSILQKGNILPQILKDPPGL